MGTLTIRNLDDNVKAKLRLAAAAKGVSMEEEVRTLITEALLPERKAPSSISAQEIIAKVKSLPDEQPQDLRFATMSHKELTDAMWSGHDGI